MCARNWVQRGASDFSLEGDVSMLVNMGRGSLDARDVVPGPSSTFVMWVSVFKSEN